MVKVPKILRYIFISLFLPVALLNAQEERNAKEPADVVTPGFTLGLNLEGPVYYFFDRDKVAFSAVTHIELAPNWFFRGEAGFENLTFSAENIEKRNYAYQSNGSFFKAGILYDFFNIEEAGNNDNVFVGLNYGFALQEHGASRFTIENSYWDNYQGSLNKYVIGTHWLEISAGPRTELVKNLYMGWTINLRIKMLQNNRQVLEPYSIPGYGKGDSNLNAGFSYVIEYFFPWGER